MKKLLKTLTVISLCLAGWALVPLVSLPTRAFGWEMFAEAYAEIFSDGFETGDTSRWTTVVPQSIFIAVADPDDYSLIFHIDGTNWHPNDPEVVTLVAGVSDQEIPSFQVEARRRGSQFELRARAVAEHNVWVETPWRPVEERYRAIEVEWKRSMARTEDGRLYVSVDGDLLLWLVDLENYPLPLRKLRLDAFAGRTVAAIYGGSELGAR